MAAGLGLATVLRASQLAFEVLRLAGAAYLIFLGSQALWSALRGARHAERSRDSALTLGPVDRSPPGILSNLANPKMVAFFLSLLPQFLPAGVPSLVGFLALGSLFCLLTFGWLSLCTVLCIGLVVGSGGAARGGFSTRARAPSSWPSASGWRCSGREGQSEVVGVSRRADQRRKVPRLAPLERSREPP